MSFISNSTERISFALGKRLDTTAHQAKRWFVVAGLISGWATGLFFASRSLVSQSAAACLIGISAYAFVRLAFDTTSCMALAAQWLLQHGGEPGKQYLTSVKAAPVAA